MKKDWKQICFFSSRLILLFFFSFLIPFPAFAQWWANLVLILPFAIIAVYLGIALALSLAFSFLTGVILNWIINPANITYSYTRPCSPPNNIQGDCNPIIGIGLQITQGLVNIILVIILVYAAISIALRLGGENEAKKIFVRLIIIALLVNFAPVLVGLIVDASNIIMNFFLDPLVKNASLSGILTQVSTNFDNLKGILGLTVELKEKFGLLASIAMSIGTNLAIGTAFLIFAGVFLVRYLAIWALTILSPVAFVAWIVPGTRRIWDMWWNQVIQWSIIGIPIAFFLYLGLGSFSLLNQTFRANLSGPLPSDTLTLASTLLPYIIVVVFLFLGFGIGLTTTAMGAAAIIGGGKAAGGLVTQRIKGWTNKATKATTKTIGKGISAGTSRLVQGAQQRMQQGQARFFDPSVVAIANWGRRIRAASQSPVGQRIISGFKGTLSFFQDIATAWAVGAGIRIGKKIERPTCPKCGNFVPAGARHCPHCSTPMPTCPQCGRLVIAGARFCQNCGAQI
jgi:hypothetical protein